jgi:hypothetical protein
LKRRRIARVGEDISRIYEITMAMRMVIPVNILGLPSSRGARLPQVVEFIGARFRKDLLLDAALAVEDRAPVLTPIQPRAAVST